MLKKLSDRPRVTIKTLLKLKKAGEKVAMLSINDLKNKAAVMIDDVPYQILEVKHLHMGRGGSSVQTRIKNLLTGQVFSRNFKPSDSFAEAGIEKRELVYLYSHRGNFIFAEKEKPPESDFSLGRSVVCARSASRMLAANFFRFPS